jgi:hypothetical protein
MDGLLKGSGHKALVGRLSDEHEWAQNVSHSTRLLFPLMMLLLESWENSMLFEIFMLAPRASEENFHMFHQVTSARVTINELTICLCLRKIAAAF